MCTPTLTKVQEKELLTLISADNPQLIDKVLPQLQSQLLFKLPSSQTTIIELLFRSNCALITQTLLLKHKAPLMTLRLKNMSNILHIALEEKACVLIKLIISNFALENYSKDSEGNSELHKWVINHSKCEKCLKALSNQSIELSAYLIGDNNNSTNPLELAAAEGNESACLLLIKYFHFDYGHIDTMNETILHKIARSNLIPIVDFVMSKSILQCLNIMNETCLTIALSKGNFHLAEFFIDKGINVSKEDKAIADSMNDIPFSLAKKIRMKKVGSNGKFLRSASSQLSIRQRLFTDRDPLTQLAQKCSEMEKEIKVSEFVEYCKSPELKLKNKLSESNILINTLELLTSQNIPEKNGNKYHIIKSSINKVIGSTSVQFAPQENSIPIAITKPNPKLNSNSKKKPLHKTFTNLTASIRNFKRNKSAEESPLKKNNSYHGSFIKSKVHYSSYLLFDHIPSFYTLEYNDIAIDKSNILHYSDHCTIYKGIYLSIHVAIKVYRLDKMLPNELKLLNNEIVLNIHLRHPHIVSFIGICIKDNLFLLVTEYLEYKSLKSLIENSQTALSRKDKMRIILEIGQGIYYLHRRNPIVFHRDLKSSNVLIDKHLTAKLCDFGISKAMDHPGQTMKTNSQSTPYWMAPEYILEGRFTDKSDIYSFGILIWEIIMGDTLPYKSNNLFDFILGNKEALKQRPFIPDDLSNTDFNDSLKQLTIQCWSNDPSLRPSIDLIIAKLEQIIQCNDNDNCNSLFE